MSPKRRKILEHSHLQVWKLTLKQQLEHCEAGIKLA